MSNEKNEPKEPVNGDAIAEQDSELAKAARRSAGKTVWTGAAVGIGSAAIVAALLYARRKT